MLYEQICTFESKTSPGDIPSLKLMAGLKTGLSPLPSTPRIYYTSLIYALIQRISLRDMPCPKHGNLPCRKTGYGSKRASIGSCSRFSLYPTFEPCRAWTISLDDYDIVMFSDKRKSIVRRLCLNRSFPFISWRIRFLEIVLV